MPDREIFPKKHQDDIRLVEHATLHSLDTSLLDGYLVRLREKRSTWAGVDRDQILERMSITRDGTPTVSGILLFGSYPQAFIPQLSITAVVIPGSEIGDTGPDGEQFLDNKRIEGNISQMLDEAMSFVRSNMRCKTIVTNGQRLDKWDYPPIAVREALLNALVHRDYSIHTEGQPIQLLLYSDRLEIRNPCGIYGRICIEQSGIVQPDTRNPVLAVAMEVLGKAENRYSGIPTMRRELEKAKMREPEFKVERGSFVVRIWNGPALHDAAEVSETAHIEKT